jgi:predicted AlkP superfamily pyrophosphatase or phosphodiesterase
MEKNMIIRTKLAFTLLLFTVFSVFFTAGCANTKPRLRAQNVPSGFVPVQHLVFIILDGWGSAYVSKANMPTVKRMMSQGANTLDARCVMPSNSWPNWASLFCGATPEQRTSDAKQEAYLNKPVKMIDYFPSIFTVLKNNGQEKKSVFFYQWDELQKICPDSATEKQSIFSDTESAMKVAAYIKEQKPVFTAVGFGEPDSTGHTKGWGSSDYYSKLAEMDGLIAIIEQAVKDAGIYDNTVFVLSSDHGGTLNGHGYNLPKHRKIPMIFYGSGIKKGFTIPSPVNNYDITPTMAALLGLKIPPEWTGRILYEIF